MPAKSFPIFLILLHLQQFMELFFRIILLFSRLSLRVLYLFSDIIFFFLFYIIGYRKAVVMTNLRNSFPEKTTSELKKIKKKFYINFSDYLVETLKSFTVSSTELKVRVQHLNQDVFRNAKKEGRNVIMLTGHVFNWEWFTALATNLPQENSHPVYRKMQSQFWEKKLKMIRNSHGNQALEAKEVVKHMLRSPNDGNSIYMFVADQTPHVSEVSYGLKFLNQKTPVFVGYDKLAAKMDLVFVYCDVKKVKRGYYQVNYYRVEPENEKFEKNEIVKKFHQLLENSIRRRPDNYLWSHRKWKYAHAIKKYDE